MHDLTCILCSLAFLTRDDHPSTANVSNLGDTLAGWHPTRTDTRPSERKSLPLSFHVKTKLLTAAHALRPVRSLRKILRQLCYQVYTYKPPSWLFVGLGLPDPNQHGGDSFINQSHTQVRYSGSTNNRQ